MKIELTENQANIILSALANESIDDEPKRGEYSYYRCYLDMKKKIDRASCQSCYNRNNNQRKEKHAN